MLKRITCLRAMLIMIFSLFALVGCAKKSGFEIGFNYVRGEERGQFIAVAARSDKTEFNIDDVTIEFSFGWFDYELDEYYPREKFVIFFINGLDNNYVVGQFNPYDLSNNIDKAEFIREIVPSEFISEKYRLTTSWKRGKEFAHSEMIKVPSNLFINNNTDGEGEVVLMLAEIIGDSGVYGVTRYRSIRLVYKFIDENTIKIIT